MNVAKYLLSEQIKIAMETLPERMRNDAAPRLIIAICFQESGLRKRIQYGTRGGLARGFAQFERIAIEDVFTRPTSKQAATDLCNALCIKPNVDYCHQAIAWNDVLMAGFCRLNLWNDPKPFPVGEQASWDAYLRIWRPGKPHPERWADSWAKSQ